MFIQDFTRWCQYSVTYLKKRNLRWNVYIMHVALWYYHVKGQIYKSFRMIFFLDRDQLVRYKFRWTDMEQMPMDNKLNKEEFLAFRHPEQSKLSMVKMVETIINSLGIFRRLKSIFRTITYEPAIKQIACHYL